MSKPDDKSSQDLKVFISGRKSKCGECGEDLGHGAWVTLVEEKGALCLSCADLDHLVFLPAGDAAKDLDENAVRLAVAVHVRHAETEYDDLLVSGCDRHEARQRVNEQLSEMLRAWKHSGS